MSPAALEIYAYGIYLMGGGTPENFKSFNVDDVQILISSYLGTQAFNARRIAKMFGDVDDG